MRSPESHDLEHDDIGQISELYITETIYLRKTSKKRISMRIFFVIQIATDNQRMMNTGKKFYLSVVKPENFTSIQRFAYILHLFSVILRIFVYKREFYNFTSNSAFYVDTGVIIATYNFFEKRSTCVKLIISEDNGKLNI